MKNYLSLVKFSHTVFAMPFALIGFFLAVQLTTAVFEWHLLLKVILCMILARNAAMAFNRYIDRNIDEKNPRTAIREIPAGIIHANAALWFVILNSVAFIITTYFINPLCLALSPVALSVVLGYSLTKRFTALCHLILGLGLSLAPIGAYLAVVGRFDILPLLFSFGVLFWVGGFDIIYALQDEEFDKQNDLFSIPVWLGKEKALMLSNVLHAITAALLFMAGRNGEFGWLFWIGYTVFITLLVYQHTLVKPNDLSKVNLAFFTTNGIASVVFASFVIADLYLL
ncbi:MAG: UbiA family prenyltransferase [Flavobacteriales bacterium]|nr:putative 4-hydroxybenzoate polyprenyltransferase [Flavobacteriales bacterium]MCB9191407.1 UbiA family prenyltransferase [Flavobacteriales bacterium]MCB9203967.1 UbiA family prenyltransferase [Flavobacteriales bacterium]